MKELEKMESEQSERMMDAEIESETCVPCKGFTRLYTPSRDEYDRHRLTHLPYRNWCPICVQSKKRNPQHNKIKNNKGLPVFSLDYMFIKGSSGLDFPIVIVTESESGGIWAIPVLRKRKLF